MMFFEIGVCFAWCVQFILLTLLAINNRGSNHIILRRLGIKNWQFVFCNYIYTFLVCLLSCFVSGIAWHFMAVLPFSGITVPFVLVMELALAILFTSTSTLLATIFGQNQTGGAIMSCMMSFFLILFACFFHAGAFESSTLFDPTMVSQQGTWLSMALLPPFAAIGLMDSMTSSLPSDDITMSIA